MQDPVTFFSKQALEEALSQYSWPERYELMETSSGSVLIRFPECSIVVFEGWECKMKAYFLNEQTGRTKTQESLTIFDAIEVIKLKKELSQTDKDLLKTAVRYLDDEPSPEKVKQGLANICILLQVYLLPCVQGDFSWVADYNTQYP